MSTQREWTTIREYEDILFDYYNGIARITINRERYRNAFTPTTTAEMSDALRICREEADIDKIARALVRNMQNMRESFVGA
mgnify:FL=1